MCSCDRSRDYLCGFHAKQKAMLLARHLLAEAVEPPARQEPADYIARIRAGQD